MKRSPMSSSSETTSLSFTLKSSYYLLKKKKFPLMLSDQICCAAPFLSFTVNWMAPLVVGFSNNIFFLLFQCIGWSLFPCCNGNYGRFKSIGFTERYPAVNSHWDIGCNFNNYCNVSSFCVVIWSLCNQKEVISGQVFCSL